MGQSGSTPEAQDRAFFCPMLAINASSILWTNSRHGDFMSALNSFLTTHSDLGRRLREQDYERLDHVLGRHFADLSVEIIKLAAFCWALVLVLAVIVVGALRVSGS